MTDKKLSEIGREMLADESWRTDECLIAFVDHKRLVRPELIIVMNRDLREQLVRRVWEAARGGEYHSNAGLKWVWDHSIESFIEKEGL